MGVCSPYNRINSMYYNQLKTNMVSVSEPFEHFNVIYSFRTSIILNTKYDIIGRHCSETRA
jgi:hypothetical protein